MQEGYYAYAIMHFYAFIFSQKSFGDFEDKRISFAMLYNFYSQVYNTFYNASWKLLEILNDFNFVDIHT